MRHEWGWRILIPLAVFLMPLLACKPAPKQTAKPGAAAGGPQVSATVVAIRTAIGEKVTSHEVLIANGRARSTSEQDLWRLYDTKADTVTFVDDVEKTYRVEPLKSMLDKRRATMAAALPAHFPRAKLTRGTTKPLLGVNAQQHVIQAGAYRRELWLAEHRAIPDDLFTLMLASDAPSSPLAPMMRDVDAALLTAKGFPLADRSEVPPGKGASIVERTVTGIASRQVPEAMLQIPRGYRDVTPKPASAKTKAAAR
jgi:hypothetical protein